MVYNKSIKFKKDEVIMGNLDTIGTSIRRIRKLNKRTLQQLANETNLSVGYLSNIERNVTSPTLTNLQKICEVLDTSLGDLIERNAQDRVIIKKEDRESYIDNMEDMKIDIVDFGIDKVSFLVVELEPASHTKEERWTHEFDEVGIVIDGQLTVMMENEEIDLNEGDAIYIKANTKHSFFNKSTTEMSRSHWTRIEISDDADECEK